MTNVTQWEWSGDQPPKMWPLVVVGEVVSEAGRVIERIAAWAMLDEGGEWVEVRTGKRIAEYPGDSFRLVSWSDITLGGGQ